VERARRASMMSRFWLGEVESCQEEMPGRKEAGRFAAVDGGGSKR
jgi:hypothetical protein